MFDDDERVPTPTPAPMPEPGVSLVSLVSLAQGVAVIHAQVDALALALFDRVFELSDRGNRFPHQCWTS